MWKKAKQDLGNKNNEPGQYLDLIIRNTFRLENFFELAFVDCEKSNEK
jgi:hypothetical protein